MKEERCGEEGRKTKINSVREREREREWVRERDALLVPKIN